MKRPKARAVQITVLEYNFRPSN